MQLNEMVIKSHIANYGSCVTIPRKFLTYKYKVNRKRRTNYGTEQKKRI